MFIYFSRGFKQILCKEYTVIDTWKKTPFVYGNNNALMEIFSAHNFGACTNVSCIIIMCGKWMGYSVYIFYMHRNTVALCSTENSDLPPPHTVFKYKLLYKWDIRYYRVTSGVFAIIYFWIMIGTGDRLNST